MPRDGAATVLAEFTMVIGFAMCVLGFMTKMMWWTFGGVLLFYMGVTNLGNKESEEGLQGEGGTDDPLDLPGP